MKRDVIIGQKLFETCKLSEFYLNLIVNSKYEDESPFQLAKAYTQKLYEIVERYDRLLEANSQRENLNLQLDATAARKKGQSGSVCSTPASALPPPPSGQARTSTPNKCFTSPSSSLATQLQLQLQMQQLHSQSTPATPCQSTSTSSINLYHLANQQTPGGMRQSSSNYQIGQRQRNLGASAYRLNSISNSNINSNFYKQNQQRLYSIYYDDYYSSDEEEHSPSPSQQQQEPQNQADVAGDEGRYKTLTLRKTGARKAPRDSLVCDVLDDMDSTILSSNNNNGSVRLDDISYDYGEYQHDTQVDLDETNSQNGNMTGASGAVSGAHDQIIEKSYSNLSKDSGVLIDSYHSDYSSHLLNQATGSLNSTGRLGKSKTVPESAKRLQTAEKRSKKAALASNGGTTSSSASISDNDETNAEQECQLLAHTRLNQYIHSADDSAINYADEDDDAVYDYEGHDDEDDEFDDDEDEDEEDEDEEPRQYSITDSTHILLKKKAAKRTQAAASLIAKLKSPPLPKEQPLSKTPSTAPAYSHYVKNPNKYSPIRTSKLAFMPNVKSSLISSPGQESDFKKQLSLIAEKHSEMDEHFESDDEQRPTLSSIEASSPNTAFNQQLNLDLDSMSMISMMVESDEQRRLRQSPNSSGKPATASLDQKVKSFSDKIKSMTNRLKSDNTNDEPTVANAGLYNSTASSTLSTPSPSSSSSSSSSDAQAQASDAAPATPSTPFTPANKSSPFLFNSISSMNVSMLDNIQATNTSLDFDNMNTSILMFN